MSKRIKGRMRREYLRLAKPFKTFSIGGSRLLLNCGNDSERWMALGLYEQDVVTAMEEVLETGDTFVDVGANIGFLSVLGRTLVGAEGHVVCFEPDPRNFSRLEENMALNAFDNVECEPVALGDHQGTVDLQISSDGGWSSTSRGITSIKGWGERFTSSRAVRMETLDGYLAKHPLIHSIKLVKVDVEGGELGVVRGAVRALSSGVIEHLLVEHNPVTFEGAGYSGADLVGALRALGFGEIQVCTPQGLRPIANPAADVFSNLIFSRPPR
ncbi:MAG TPA: FkbM family methyltransferase [Actinomycetota bacterium]|nr:FkbM family methyltransferase [Actinomycetota bacterium]